MTKPHETTQSQAAQKIRPEQPAEIEVYRVGLTTAFLSYQIVRRIPRPV